MRLLGSRTSLRRRLTLAMLFMGIVPLSLGGLVFGLYEYSRLRQEITRDIGILANIVEPAAAKALAARDPEAGEASLLGLAADPLVIAAAVYDENGQRFASYRARHSEHVSIPAWTDSTMRFDGSTLHWSQPIVSRGTTLGTLSVRSSTRTLMRRLEFYTALSVVLAVTVLGAGLATAARLSRRVAGPLEELTRRSAAIARGDFSARMEIVELEEGAASARAFNRMGDVLRTALSSFREALASVTDVAVSLRESGRGLHDEMGQQSDAIEEASKSLLQVSTSIQQVNGNVENLADSARETSASIVEMDATIRAVADHMSHLEESIDATSSGISKVSGTTERVVSSVEALESATQGTLGRLTELSASVSRVEGNARASHELSDDTSLEATKGLGAVRETISAMREISDSFGQLDDRVTRLANKSSSIDEILQVISGVAEQTSLLSLNAAIIAAQAGEQGKAFSVVADEISTLADRTRNSAQDISRLIIEVREDTAAAVEAAEVGAAVVQQGVVRSNEAGRVLERISEKSRISAERVHEISDATLSQSNEIQGVNQAMLEVRELVGRIIEATGDQRRATDDIAASVEKIRALARGVKNSTVEQRKGSQLITQAVTDVSEMINQIAHSTQAQAASRQTIQQALEILNTAAARAAERVQVINEVVETLFERTGRLEAKIEPLHVDHGAGPVEATKLPRIGTA